MSEATIPAQGPVDVNVRPVAWLHDQPERYDVVHDEARALWLKACPKQVEHYTIPLYRHERREPLTTEAACTLLKDALGIDPLLDGNMLKMLRAVELAHGIGPNADVAPDNVADAVAKGGAHAAFFVRQWIATTEAAPVVRELQALGQVSVGMCSAWEFCEQ